MNQFDEQLSAIEDAVGSWLKQNTPKNLETAVHKQLDAQRKRVVLQLLGFRDTWGKWEVDPFDKKDRSQVAKEHIDIAVKAATIKWLEEVELPPLTETMVNGLTHKFEQDVQRNIQQALYEKAKVVAAQTVDKMILDITEDLDITNRLKTYGLLSQTQKE